MNTNHTISVESYTDYYASGWEMPGRTYTSANRTRFGYQGAFTENDADLGMTTFDLRAYDPRLMRWHNPDPYDQFHSPYVAMGNDWVNGVDASGGESFFQGVGRFFRNMFRDKWYETKEGHFLTKNPPRYSYMWLHITTRLFENSKVVYEHTYNIKYQKSKVTGRVSVVPGDQNHYPKAFPKGSAPFSITIGKDNTKNLPPKLDGTPPGWTRDSHDDYWRSDIKLTDLGSTWSVMWGGTFMVQGGAQNFQGGAAVSRERTWSQNYAKGDILFTQHGGVNPNLIFSASDNTSATGEVSIFKLVNDKEANYYHIETVPTWSSSPIDYVKHNYGQTFDWVFPD